MGDQLKMEMETQVDLELQVKMVREKLKMETETHHLETALKMALKMALWMEVPNRMINQHVHKNLCSAQVCCWCRHDTVVLRWLWINQPKMSECLFTTQQGKTISWDSLCLNLARQFVHKFSGVA